MILNDKCDGEKKASSRIRRDAEVEGQMAIFKGGSGFYSLRKHLSQMKDMSKLEDAWGKIAPSKGNSQC